MIARWQLVSAANECAYIWTTLRTDLGAAKLGITNQRRNRGFPAFKVRGEVKSLSDDGGPQIGCGSVNAPTVQRRLDVRPMLEGQIREKMVRELLRSGYRPAL